MKKLLVLAAFLFLPLTASAGEEALYAPVPPSDSAFVRAVNATGDAALSATLDGAKFPAGVQESVSDYAVIKQGDHALKVGASDQALKIEAGQYYTIVVLKGGVAKVIKDALIENPAKAMIYFYNLSDAAAATLEAPSHNATIFENIAAGEGKSREINAVAFSLSVKADAAEAGKVDNLELKRQQGNSVFLTGEKGQYKVFAVTNKVAQ